MVTGTNKNSNIPTPGQQDSSNALPRAKAIDQIPSLCPASPLSGLKLIEYQN